MNTDKKPKLTLDRVAEAITSVLALGIVIALSVLAITFVIASSLAVVYLVLDLC